MMSPFCPFSVYQINSFAVDIKNSLHKSITYCLQFSSQLIKK